MSNPTATPDHNESDPRIARCRRAVEELIEIGMNLARRLDPTRGPSPVRDPYLAYWRVSRAIRLALLLDLRLDDLAAGGAAALAVEPTLDEIATNDDAADLSETLERAEAAETGRPHLDREAPDEIWRYANRPLTELVAAICRDLDLSPEETADRQAPFADLVANDDGPDRASADAESATPIPPTAAGRPPARRDRALGP